MVERVVVCGATGQQGSAVVRSLLASRRWEVVALSRSPGRLFERHGKPPFPAEFLAAVEDTRRLCPGWTSMARYLEQRGFASAELR